MVNSGTFHNNFLILGNRLFSNLIFDNMEISEQEYNVLVQKYYIDEGNYINQVGLEFE